MVLELYPIKKVTFHCLSVAKRESDTVTCHVQMFLHLCCSGQAESPSGLCVHPGTFRVRFLLLLDDVTGGKMRERLRALSRVQIE